VVVYAGAIMVLVVFVIMLLNVGREEQAPSARSLRPTLAMLISGVLVVMVSSVIASNPTGKNELSEKAVEIGTTASIGNALFKDYLFPFEAVSLLLLAALIGAVILAKRHVSETNS
jgi:NADH-quinone oxidoreductase subunit J